MAKFRLHHVLHYQVQKMLETYIYQESANYSFLGVQEVFDSFASNF